ncbi:MAG: helix-turn-helix transcriptional regulator [Thermoflexaceae bacterium]|nr:helix-turn-helix transcriptional regulator [Thermoflexaceae bacterium]
MDIKDLEKIIQNNIVNLLNNNPNISMRTLSDAIDGSPSYIQKILGGKFTPSLNKLIEISNYFNVPVSTLFSEGNFSPEEEAIIAKLDSLSDESLKMVSLLVSYLAEIDKKNKE